MYAEFHHWDHRAPWALVPHERRIARRNDIHRGLTGNQRVAVFELDSDDHLYAVLIPFAGFDIVVHAVASSLDGDHGRGLFLVVSPRQSRFIGPAGHE